MNYRDKQILRIALPAIVTNITIPLLGLVDMAIVGHMGDAKYIGAIAVGSMIFNLFYWVFGFLRMGTSGMTAQARGRRDFAEVCQLLRRSLTVSMGIALLTILLQWPLRELMLWLIGPTADVYPLSVTYFNIVVWGAPAVLGLYALSGWYIGMQNSRIPMVISIMQNIVNIVASLGLVYGLGLKVEGVAMGTLIAQYAGFLLAVGLLWYYYRRLWHGKKRPLVSEKFAQGSPLTAFFRVNRDIFLRTLCLVAVNTLLMQLYLLFSYVMDGFAFAGEALGGRYWGARNWEAYRNVVKRLFGWGALMTVSFTLTYVLGGMPFLCLLTDEPGVVEASRQYVWWAYLIPVSGVAAFIWDGIFIGTTQTRGMLLSSVIAAVVFFLCALLLTGPWGNHGLWLAMVAYLAVRGIVQTMIHQSAR